jgi:hypothetical protein
MWPGERFLLCDCLEVADLECESATIVGLTKYWGKVDASGERKVFDSEGTAVADELAVYPDVSDEYSESKGWLDVSYITLNSGSRSCGRERWSGKGFCTQVSIKSCAREQCEGQLAADEIATLCDDDRPLHPAVSVLPDWTIDASAHTAWTILKTGARRCSALGGIWYGAVPRKRSKKR